MIDLQENYQEEVNQIKSNDINVTINRSDKIDSDHNSIHENNIDNVIDKNDRLSNHSNSTLKNIKKSFILKTKSVKITDKSQLIDDIGMDDTINLELFKYEVEVATLGVIVLDFEVERSINELLGWRIILTNNKLTEKL